MLIPFALDSCIFFPFCTISQIEYKNIVIWFWSILILSREKKTNFVFNVQETTWHGKRLVQYNGWRKVSMDTDYSFNCSSLLFSLKMNWTLFNFVFYLFLVVSTKFCIYPPGKRSMCVCSLIRREKTACSIHLFIHANAEGIWMSVGTFTCDF